MWWACVVRGEGWWCRDANSCCYVLAGADGLEDGALELAGKAASAHLTSDVEDLVQSEVAVVLDCKMEKQAGWMGG